MADTTSVHRHFKKQELSTEPSRYPEAYLTCGSTDVRSQPGTPTVGSLKGPSDPADYATVLALLSRFNDTVEARVAAAEAVKDRRQALFDAACGRANRRANEAELQLRSEREQHLADARSNDQRFLQLENAKLAAEHTAQALIASKDRRITELETTGLERQRAELESVRLAAANREREVQAVIGDLRNTILEKDSELRTKEEQLKLYDQLRELIQSEVKKLIKAQRQDAVALEAIKEHQSAIKRLSTLLNSNVLVSKLLTCLDELRATCTSIEPVLDALVMNWQAATDARNSFRTQFTFDGLDELTLEMEARTGELGEKD